MPEVKRLDSFGCMVFMGGEKGAQAEEYNAKRLAYGVDLIRRDSFAMPNGGRTPRSARIEGKGRVPAAAATRRRAGESGPGYLVVDVLFFVEPTTGACLLVHLVLHLSRGLPRLTCGSVLA